MKMKMALFALSALSSAAVSSAFLERTKVGTTEVDEQVKDEKFFVNGIYDPLVSLAYTFCMPWLALKL
jgi:hypothetical protein